MSKVPVSPLQTEAEYKAAIVEMRKLWNEKLKSKTRLDVLINLVVAYEAKHHPIDPPEPIDAIKIRMDDLDMSPHDLGGMLGVDTECALRILDRRQLLTRDWITKLSVGLGLSERCLAQV